MANSDLIGSLVRAMEILKLLGNYPNGCRVEDISRAANLKLPTTYSILRTLIAGGFVERRGRVLRIGREIRRLAGIEDNRKLEDAVELELLSLYQAFPTGTVIFGLSVPQGIELTHRVSFDRPSVVQNLSHEVMHPYATAAGLVGLAFANEDEFLLQSEKWPFTEFGAHLWKSRSRLEAYLERIRQERLAFLPFDRELFRRVSGAIFDPDGKLYAIVGLSIPTVHLHNSGEKVVEVAIRKSMQTLTQALVDSLKPDLTV